jgi:hypothetical protein
MKEVRMAGTKPNVTERRYEAVTKLLDNILGNMQEIRERQLELSDRFDQQQLVLELLTAVIKTKVITPQAYDELLKAHLGVEGMIQ